MTEENQSSAVRKHNNKWRVVDIVVAAIIAVASGVIFWGWDIVCTAPLALFEAVTPGFEGLLNAFWLFAGPLAAIIVRKPGAALFAETLAAAGHRQDRRARPLRIRSYAGTGLIVRCKQIPHHIKVVRDFLVMAHRMTTAYETTA